MKRSYNYIKLTILITSLLILFFFPVRTTIIRGIIILLIAMPLIYLIKNYWSKFYIGKALLTGTIILLIWGITTFTLVPINQKTFIQHVQSYENVPFVWGGENSFGLDCSGLIRQSLLKTYLSQYRIGSAFQIWFIDCPAKHLSTKYSNILREYKKAVLIKNVTNLNIPLGTLAVTTTGNHVLAYVGNNSWAQASPDDMKVTIKNYSENDPWFLKKVNMYELSY
jgi:hypothetical protein